MEKITCDTIIDFLKNIIEEKKILPPSVFIDAAEKLNILRSDEDDKLVGLMQKVAQLKSNSILSGNSVAQAKVHAEASDDYKLMLMQKMRCERITEFIRIEKIRARLKDTDLSGF
jgi:uncharacterized protein YfeS